MPSASSSPPQAAEVSPRNSLNALTAREWLSESVSVWNQRGLGAGHVEAQIERQHPAPFSYSDVARLVRMFTKPGMTVLDPFAGVGSTLKACALEDRGGIGFELYPHFVDLARRRLQEEVPSPKAAFQEIRQGDVRELAQGLERGSIDFMVTSPPYWSILSKKPDHKVESERVARGLRVEYGDDPRDLAAIDSYDAFVQELGDCLQLCADALRPGAYAALIVGDFRHGGRYYMFHADLAREMECRGLVLQASNVLYQRHKRVFPYGYPYAYVPNVHHQNIVIMRKPR